MLNKDNKNAIRKKRHQRMRNKECNPLTGSAEMPRLNVYRSLSHIYAQVIDDQKGVTLCAASTVEKEIAAKVQGLTKVAAAGVVGEVIGERALAQGITAVVFDRGGYLYTGRVEALAQGARKAGLDF